MKVHVSAPARLHLGDIDPFGLGRFGYAPILAIDTPRTRVEAAPSRSLQVSGLVDDDVRGYATRVVNAFNLPGACVKVLSTAPRHSGFGSTTQLALSIGQAITRAYERAVDSVDLVTALNRTSTGGLHTFQRGGFVVAGGLQVPPREPIFHREEALIPPLVLRAAFPEAWRFLLVHPLKAAQSPSGAAEEDAFKTLHGEQPPSHLIHEAYFTLMAHLVPAVLEKDATAFGAALTKIQVLVGRIYQPVQGSVFNPSSAWVIPLLSRAGALGVGQSSWGPTVYAFVEDETQATAMKDALRPELEGRANEFIVEADNAGATTSILEAE